MLTRGFAEQFAQEWIAAWNGHDLERILSHYSDDFVMSSPRIAVLTEEPTGVLKGKDAIRCYWKKALELVPHLHFELMGIYLGADSIILHYEGPRGKAAEAFFFNEEGKVVRAAATYE
ncbi:MAG: nuclear transport factor 2 family protein [Blastocatellia bacterium]|nr:nuclear transport factor 2 family protein [Blastocatellia bacterium]